MRKVSIALLVLVLAVTLVGTTVAQAPAIQPKSPAAPHAAPAAPAPLNTLWDQPASTTNTGAYADQDFETTYDAYDIFDADDFTNAAPWNITKIFVPGDLWNGGTTLANATSLVFQIYADNGGVPAGDPRSGGAYWSLSLAPSDPQIVLSNGNFGYPSDVTLNLATPLNLPAGNWWFVFYPSMTFGAGYGQYGRNVATTQNGLQAMVINPGGGFAFPAVWSPAPPLYGFAEYEFAFRLEGTPVLNSLHLFKLKLAWAAGTKPGTYKVSSTVVVHDQDQHLAPGVTVAADWTAPNGTVTPQNAVTNAKGQAKFSLKAKAAGVYQFCVVSLAKTGYTDNPGGDQTPRCQTINVGP